MLESHVESSSVCRRLREGPAGPHVDAFVQWLLLQGYSSIAVDQKCQFLVRFTDWLAQHDRGGDVVAGLDAYRAALAAKVRISRIVIAETAAS
jgi:hypothetical protein